MLPPGTLRKSHREAKWTLMAIGGRRVTRFSHIMGKTQESVCYTTGKVIGVKLRRFPSWGKEVMRNPSNICVKQTPHRQSAVWLETPSVKRCCRASVAAQHCVEQKPSSEVTEAEHILSRSTQLKTVLRRTVRICTGRNQRRASHGGVQMGIL